MKQWLRRLGGLGVLMACGLSMTGCDYWPPALQAQIEQLQAEAQTAAAERAKLLNQLSETMKVKDELQARLDDVGRSNRELMTKVTSLEHALTAEKEKVSHLAKAALKPAGKTTKPVAKSTPGKKSDKKKLTAMKKRN